jgi:hypothetical protein
METPVLATTVAAPENRGKGALAAAANRGPNHLLALVFGFLGLSVCVHAVALV